MSEDPRRREPFLERILQRRPSHSEGETSNLQRRPSLGETTSALTPDKETPDLDPMETLYSNESQSQSHTLDLGHSHSHSLHYSEYQGQDPGERERPQMLRRQRRSSKLQRLRDMLRSEEELDETEKIYAKLM